MRKKEKEVVKKESSYNKIIHKKIEKLKARLK